MDTTFDKMLADDCIELVENKKYYLIETFKQEQMIGTIKQGQIYKFIRVDVLNRYGDGIEYSKYISTGSITAMTPISKDTAMELAKVAKPVNRSISSLTTNNGDLWFNTDNTKGKASEVLANEVNLPNKPKEVNKKIFMNRMSILKAKMLVSIASLLAFIIFYNEQTLSFQMLLIVSVAPAMMLLFALFEISLLD